MGESSIRDLRVPLNTGSFNFTKAAEESNAENLLIIRDTRLADQYADNWNSHAKHAEGFEAKVAR